MQSNRNISHLCDGNRKFTEIHTRVNRDISHFRTLFHSFQSSNCMRCKLHKGYLNRWQYAITFMAGETCTIPLVLSRMTSIKQKRLSFFTLISTVQIVITKVAFHWHINWARKMLHFFDVFKLGCGFRRITQKRTIYLIKTHKKLPAHSSSRNGLLRVSPKC